MPIGTLRISLEVKADDGSLALEYVPGAIRWSPGVLKRETVTLTAAAFTTFTQPSGASLLIVIPASAAASLTLKGVTGDSGIGSVPNTLYKGFPMLLPLSAAINVGIANAGAVTTAELIWL